MCYIMQKSIGIGQLRDMLVHLQSRKRSMNREGHKMNYYRSYRRINTLFIHIL